MLEEKCKCGSSILTLMRKKGSKQVGLYCKTCGRWQKWVGKQELTKFILNGTTIQEVEM